MIEKQFKFIEQYLKLHGFFDIARENIKEKVMEFQKKKGLFQDAILGPKTLWELQYEPTMDAKKLSLVPVKADQIDDSYAHFVIREDLVKNYEEVRKVMIEKRALIPSSGGLRSLNAKVSKGRSATSFHYTGLALDFYIWSGLQDPTRDPFVLTLEPDLEHFHIYARSKHAAGAKLSLEAIYIKKSELSMKMVSGRFFSFTDLLAKYGLTPISLYRSFFKNPKRNYLTSEWWHFQWNGILTEKCSIFGIELLKCYTLEQIKETPPWKFRKAVFNRNGFYMKQLDWIYL